MSNQYFATSPDQLATLDDILDCSGLEYMQGILDGKFAAPPIGQTLGFRLHKVQDGQAIFEGVPEFKVMNPIGTVHGGWYGTILDSCMACAVQTKLKAGQIYTTLEYKINIIRPIPVGTRVHAVGTVHHSGRSTGISNGEIIGADDGRLYATGSTTCIIMDGPKRA